LRKHERGDIPQVPWLDKLVFAKIDEMQIQEPESKQAYLLIELPTFDFPVVFSETPYTVFIDPEIDNPVENKHRRLARSERHTSFDVDLKPNSKIRDELNVRVVFTNLP
jgi:phosphatidylinositol 3-kinase